jgi:uncharacterized protein YhhL (DUF1145 family)
MNNIVKTSCLAIYLLAAIGAYGVLPAGVASAIQLVAVVLVAAHALELLVAFKAVKRHPGPLVDSIALTLLFGFLHWLPLRKRKRDL